VPRRILIRLAHIHQQQIRLVDQLHRQVRDRYIPIPRRQRRIVRLQRRNDRVSLGCRGSLCLLDRQASSGPAAEAAAQVANIGIAQRAQDGRRHVAAMPTLAVHHDVRVFGRRQFTHMAHQLFQRHRHRTRNVAIRRPLRRRAHIHQHIRRVLNQLDVQVLRRHRTPAIRNARQPGIHRRQHVRIHRRSRTAHRFHNIRRNREFLAFPRLEPTSHVPHIAVAQDLQRRHRN